MSRTEFIVGERVFVPFVDTGDDGNGNPLITIKTEEAKILQVDEAHGEVVLDTPIQSLKGQRVFSTFGGEAQKTLFPNEGEAIRSVRDTSETRIRNLQGMIASHEATIGACVSQLSEIGLE